VNPPLVAVSLLSGTSLLFLLPRLPPVPLLLAILLVLALLYVKWRFVWVGCVVAALAGFAWAAFIAHLLLSDQVPLKAGRIDSRIDATVIGIVRQKGSTLILQAETRLVVDQQPVRVDLRWYEFPANRQPPIPGETWRLNVRLRAPRGSANPGGRYWEDHAFRHGVAASGYVRSGKNEYLSTSVGRAAITRLRNRLSREIGGALAQRLTGPLVVALAVGDRQHLSDEHWQVLRKTGLSHLVAISGLHIGIVAGLAYALGAALGGLRDRGVVAACLCSAALATGYAALAGFTIPTRRALIVVFILLAARLSKRQLRPGHALSLALILVVLQDPMTPLDAGFWLSFAAVAVILYVSVGQLSRGGLHDLWRLQLAILFGLSPLMIILFGQLSLAAPAVNILVLPLFSFLFVPAVLIGVVTWLFHGATGLWIFHTVAALMDTVWPWLVRISEVDVLTRQFSTPGLAAILLAVFGAFWCLAPRGWPARWLGLICLVPALWYRPPAPSPGSFELTVLDVGQGLAVVVRTNRHRLVFDTGPKWRSGNDAAGRIVIPYLNSTGAGSIDRLVISHGDTDHAGGLRTLMLHYTEVPVLAGDIDGVNPCLRGQRWFWDGVGFEILHPPAGERWTGNSASCVLRITNGRHCALLTGDIEADAEQVLVRTHPSGLECDLVLAPHHGSETSSTQRFVTAVRPRYVFVSASHTNPWGFPRPAVVSRWHRSGAHVLNTATSGAISAHIAAGGGISITTQRCQRQRFWRQGGLCDELSESGTAFGTRGR